MAFPDKWSETAIITIAPQGGANIDLSPIIDSIDEDLGDKEVEYTANLKGGRSEKFVPEEVTTITFEGYPVTIETAPALAEHVGVLQLFHNTRGNWDTTQPMTIDCSRNREKYGLAIVWTDDTTMTSATGSNSIGNTAERTIFLFPMFLAINHFHQPLKSHRPHSLLNLHCARDIFFPHF